MTSKVTESFKIADTDGHSDDVSRRIFMKRLGKNAGVGMLAGGSLLRAADATRGEEVASSMPHHEYAKHDATSLASLVRTGEVSAEEGVAAWAP